jgi:hypothetical protein
MSKPAQLIEKARALAEQLTPEARAQFFAGIFQGFCPRCGNRAGRACLKCTDDSLLRPKELAYALRKAPNYVYAMKMRGFVMAGGVATIREARSWIVRNMGPYSRKWVKTTKTNNGV